MKIVFRAVLVVALMGLCASSAFALDYANDATKGISYKATVDNLANLAGGTSETDDNVATVRYTGGSGGDGRIEIEFEFPTWTLAAGDHKIWLVVDNTVTGVVKAKVREINGVANTGTLATISGTNMQDELFGLNFSLSQDTQVTSVLVRILVDDKGSGSKIDIDAVATPEPGTLILFGLGALGLGAWNYRRKKTKKA